MKRNESWLSKELAYTWLDHHPDNEKMASFYGVFWDTGNGEAVGAVTAVTASRTGSNWWLLHGGLVEPRFVNTKGDLEAFVMKVPVTFGNPAPKVLLAPQEQLQRLLTKFLDLPLVNTYNIHPDIREVVDEDEDD